MAPSCGQINMCCNWDSSGSHVLSDIDDATKVMNSNAWLLCIVCRQNISVPQYFPSLTRTHSSCFYSSAHSTVKIPQAFKYPSLILGLIFLGRCRNVLALRKTAQDGTEQLTLSCACLCKQSYRHNGVLGKRSVKTTPAVGPWETRRPKHVSES